MKVHIGDDVARTIVGALAKAGQREVGGIMFGEHLGGDSFRIVDVTVQTKHGTFASFVRMVEDCIGPLRGFFQRSRHQYEKFNYLGEWHSHHSFSLLPSSTDSRTMREIVDDPEVGARFAVLLLVRTEVTGALGAAATLFLPGGATMACIVLKDGG